MTRRRRYSDSRWANTSVQPAVELSRLPVASSAGGGGAGVVVAGDDGDGGAAADGGVGRSDGSSGRVSHKGVIRDVERNERAEETPYVLIKHMLEFFSKVTAQAHPELREGEQCRASSRWIHPSTLE
ncbi:hypothetical protein HZH68_010349 [Vespula germanica]|uniref:Uncharacterized protein n=1 Tax=Vespula germanica TaxID=30212 RepID=A0A834N2M3_VESGE|nr:hypothetical protein HZH68_010349 [Vespula germanica]